MGNQKVREKKKPTFFLAVLPILAMILLLGVGYAVMGLSPEVLMLVSIILGGIMGLDGIWWAISSTSIVKGIIFTCTFLWITRKRR
mgnify:CR=1 FL=1